MPSIRFLKGFPVSKPHQQLIFTNSERFWCRCLTDDETILTSISPINNKHKLSVLISIMLVESE